MLANISTRGSVGTGDDVLIGGFILQPDGGVSSTILVRAIGPSLAAAQVAGPLQDPEIELYDSNGEVSRSTITGRFSRDQIRGDRTCAPERPGVSHPEDLGGWPLYRDRTGREYDERGVALVEIYKLP